LILSFNKAIRSRTIRRSVSISVSWSTHPIPPFDVLSASTIRQSRQHINTLRQFDLCSRIGSFGTLCKISRISASCPNFTFGYDFRYIFLLDGDNSSSNTKVDISFSLTKGESLQFFQFLQSFRIRSFHFFVKRFTTWPPAVKVKTLIHQDIRLVFVHFDFGYDTYNSCFFEI
jgi:hypothetical protein